MVFMKVMNDRTVKMVMKLFRVFFSNFARLIIKLILIGCTKHSKGCDSLNHAAKGRIMLNAEFLNMVIMTIRIP